MPPGSVDLRAGKPGEHPGVLTAQGGGDDSGPFDRLPRGQQRESLRGMHRLRLQLFDPEELGIEIPPSWMKEPNLVELVPGSVRSG
jgi:hypothetical protein